MRALVLMLGTTAVAMSTAATASPPAAGGVATDHVLVFPDGLRTDQFTLDAALVLDQRPWSGRLEGGTFPWTPYVPGRIASFELIGTGTVPGDDLRGTCQGTVIDRSTKKAMADVITLACSLGAADGTPGQPVTLRLVVVGPGSPSQFAHVDVTAYDLVGTIAG